VLYHYVDNKLIFQSMSVSKHPKPGQ